MKIDEENNFYIKNKEKYLKQFNKLVNNPNVKKKVLLNYFDQPTKDEIITDWIQELEAIFPKIPDIGGKQNKIMIFFLMGGVVWLAFYHVLSRRGKKIEEIGKMIYKIVEQYYESLNYFQKKYVQWYYFSRLAQNRFKKNCKNRREWQYPGDYQSIFIEGDKATFVWGFNYTECAILKFLKSENSLEILPYICLIDYAMFRGLGVGFKRTQTLGMCGKVCDFRFIRNYQTQKGWPPDQLEEYKQYAEHLNKP